MKTLIVLLLILTFTFPAMGFAEEKPFTGYKSDFSSDADGWYPRSAGTAALEAADDVLKITGRTAAWNSPGRDFNLVSGSRYQFSLLVRQDDVEEANFIFSMAHSRDGAETYENLVKVTAVKGQWTKLEGNFVPDAYDNYVLYVETEGNDMLDFQMKDVVIEPMGIVYDMTLPSLSKAYAPYFDLGCAVNQSTAGDAKRMSFYAHEFNIMTHENELKPDSVLDVNASRALAQEDDTAVAVRFGAAKPLLDFCLKNGIKVHGHTLVWHNQTPDVFFREGYLASGDYVTREVMLARLDNYIRLVMEYMEENYPGLIVSWDVVNEAVSDNTTNLRSSNWTKVVGEDFVNRAFEIARKYAPEGTLLYYNDYSTPYEPKLSGICKLLDSLVAEGNIDGYGFQCHYSTMTPAPSAVRNAMEKITAKGLRLRVSELDVGVKTNSDLDQRIQAYKYTDLFKVFVEFADKLDAVQFWGVTDDKSWRSREYPLIFDNKVRPKPSFYAVLEVVQPPQE